jgi:hypothetical protein
MKASFTHLGKMHYKSTKSTLCNTSTRRSFSYPTQIQYVRAGVLHNGRLSEAEAIRQSRTEADQEWDLLRVAVAHKVANQLAQVHSQLTHMRHYDDRNRSKTRGWLRQHIIGSK